jgi:hypothetical protein
MLTSIDVIKQGCQLQFVHENQMHLILRPNYMSHDSCHWLSQDFAMRALVGHSGFDPEKKFENLSVCRVDLHIT